MIMRFTDQTGRQVQMDKKPERIISLVPSQTELLYDLHLEAEVCGITKFCPRPENGFDRSMIIGGTKSVHIDKAIALEPDLVLANKEENEKQQVETLMAACPVWVSDVKDLTGAIRMIRSVGALCRRDAMAGQLALRIETTFDALPAITRKPRAAYLIWNDPIMTAGGDTFIQSMMDYFGVENVFGQKTRYPETSIDELKKLGTQVLLLSSEPFPFRSKHLQAFRNAMPGTRVLLVDGQKFSWYGSHLAQTPAYLKQLRQALDISG